MCIRDRLIASPVQLTNMAFNNLLRAEGSAVQSMVGMVIGAVLNMILDPVFIFTFNMGVMGAAVATAISQAVSFAILSLSLIHICSGSPSQRNHTRKTTRKLQAFRLISFRFSI